MRKVIPVKTSRISESMFKDTTSRTNHKTKTRSNQELPAKKASAPDVQFKSVEVCQAHNKTTVRFCQQCNLFVCSECLETKCHIGHKMETPKLKFPNDSAGPHPLLSEIQQTRNSIYNSSQIKQKFYLSQTRMNFSNLIKEVERKRDQAETKIIDYFKSIQDSLDTWSKNISKRVQKLEVESQTNENLFDFNLEVRKIKKDVQVVSQELASIDTLQFVFDIKIFENMKDFCCINVNETSFLEHFRKLKDDDLFMESIHDPFTETHPDAVALVHPDSARYQSRAEEAPIVRKNFCSFRTNSVNRILPQISMVLESKLQTPKNRKSMLSMKFETHDFPVADKSVLINTERSALWKDNSMFRSAVGEGAPGRGSLSNRRYTAQASSFAPGIFGTSLNNTIIPPILKRNSSNQGLETERRISKSLNRASASTFEIPVLDLANKKMTEDEFINFFGNLKVNTPIKVLDLSRNKITDNFLQKIFNKIVSYSINTIILDFNLLTESSFDHFMNFKHQNERIEAFSVKGNPEINMSLESVPRKIQILKALFVKVII